MRMRINKLNAVALALIGIVVVVASFAFCQLCASNLLLQKIKLVPPGVQLQSVTNQLGLMLYEFTDLDVIIQRGSIKDRRFCQDKKLFWFATPLPPSRALEVYTDTNDVVVYVTWQGL